MFIAKKMFSSGALNPVFQPSPFQLTVHFSRPPAPTPAGGENLRIGGFFVDSVSFDGGEDLMMDWIFSMKKKCYRFFWVARVCLKSEFDTTKGWLFVFQENSIFWSTFEEKNGII